MTQIKNPAYKGDSKVVVSPRLPETQELSLSKSSTISTSEKPSWWQNLNFKNQIVLIAIASCFASTTVVGGASYFLPNHLGSLLTGSSFAAVITGVIILVATRKFSNAIADANSTINQLGNGELDSWGDKQLDELELLG